MRACYVCVLVWLRRQEHKFKVRTLSEADPPLYSATNTNAPGGLVKP